MVEADMCSSSDTRHFWWTRNYLLQVSRYIHRNPVEAKLVERPQDYRWSSYGAYVGRGRVRSLRTATVLEQLGAKQREQIRRYREYVESIPAEA